MRCLRAVGLLLLAMLLALAPVEAAEWRRLESPHFTFVGDVSDRDLRGVAVRLESFRAAVSRVLPPGSAAARVPTVVLVFRNDQAFTPYKPQFNGRPVAVAGYFAGTDEVRYLAVNAEQESDAYGVIFHEYAHALLGHLVGDAPPWVDEGLAEFYETFQAAGDSSGATIGAPNRENLDVLRSMSLMPLADLVAVQRDSPLYNEGQRRTLFYAQSWALVHYLTFGPAERTAQLNRYLETLRRGIAPAEAFIAAFGTDLAGLERELREYVGSQTMKAVRVQFGDAVPGPGAANAETLPEAEAAAYLGDLLARLGRTEDARGRLRAVVSAHPDAGRAMAALGMLELEAGRTATALPLLERAVRLMPDSASVVGALGRALVSQAEQGGPDAADLYARARTLLSRAVVLDPATASSALMLAALELSQGADVARAVTLLRGLVEQWPGREAYRLMLARALAAQGAYADASDLLGPLVARGSRPEMREAARELLGQIASARRTPASTPAPR